MTDRKKEEILQAYYFRHACKEFDASRKISEEDFHFILETARLSPSSFGFEPWKFLIVQNPEVREKIRPVCWGAQKQLPTASHFIIILARTIDDMIYSSQYLDSFMRDVKELPEDALAARKERYEKFQKNDFKLLESDRSLFDWTCKQTYIVLGNMMTAAAEIGIDSCAIEGFDREKAEQLLEQEGILDRKKFGISCMAAFGYRKDEPRAKTRQRVDQIIEWI
ncbi:MAG: NAD(P)H-dependent oxidoreductase [Bacillota bacterium]